MQPVNVSSNVSFVVNIEALDNPNDLKADDVGVWERKGSPVAYVSVHKRNGKIQIYRRSKLGSTSNHFKITRTYYKHADSPDFSRLIVTVHGKELLKLFAQFTMKIEMECFCVSSLFWTVIAVNGIGINCSI